MAQDKLIEVIASLLMPWHFLLIACGFIPPTIISHYNATGFSSLFPWHKFQNAWFSRFWAWMGPRIREGNGPRIAALLEGRVTAAQVVDKVVSEPIGGVVLDIGPGLGYWVDLYARTNVLIQNDGKVVKNREKRRGITTVYGIEPNTQSYPGLRQSVLAAGLEGIYKILPVGIENIAKETAVEKGNVDAIVSLLCLCSIPEPEKNIKELYSYLKPGGRWYVYEHVKSKGYWPMQIYQAIVNWFWPLAYGGCQLCRDTEKALREAGPWSNVDLKQPPEEPWHATIPHIFGTLTK